VPCRRRICSSGQGRGGVWGFWGNWVCGYISACDVINGFDCLESEGSGCLRGFLEWDGMVVGGYLVGSISD